MAEGASKHLFLCLLFVLTFCSSGSFPTREFEDEGLKRRVDRSYHHRKLHEQFRYKTTQRDTVVYPTPTVVTVPASSTVPPTINPTNPPAIPITNPVTTPSTFPAGAQPVTNPVTTFPSPSSSSSGGGGVPVTSPPGGVVAAVPPPPPASSSDSTAGPAVSGQQGWCVAKSGTVESALQSALDYACGIGGADCSAIQEGASCYNPNTLAYHASYAFNSYYQKNPMQTSCDFGGTAVLTNTNPSAGTCVFPTSSSSTSSGTNNTPTTDSSSSSSGAAAVPAAPGSGTTNPALLNTSYPAASAFGEEIPPAFNSSTTSMATTIQPFVGLYTILLTSVVTAKFALHHVDN